MIKKIINSGSKSNQNYDYNSSDEDNDDAYPNALMSSLLALSNKNLSSDKMFEKKPTEERIEFVKNLLVGNSLNSMIDFNKCDIWLRFAQSFKHRSNGTTRWAPNQRQLKI